METVLIQPTCVVLIITWLSVTNGKAVGHVIPQHSPLLLKTNGNNVEVYRDNGDGGSWLQMVLVFARDSSNNQSALLIENEPCTECEKTVVCKDGFIELESKKCYYFSSHRETWHNALQVCQSMVTTLAYPMSANENTALVNHLITKHNGTLGWWLGGSDQAKEGEWVWAHSKAPMTYNDWMAGQPSNYNKNEHCLQLWKEPQWKWNDRLCTDPYPFICQQ